MDLANKSPVSRRVNLYRSLRNLRRSCLSADTPDNPRPGLLEIYFKKRMAGQIVIQGSRNLFPRKP